MMGQRSGPIDREKYYVKRLDEGVRITMDLVAPQMAEMKRGQPALYDHNVKMFTRVDARYFSLLGPRHTSAADDPLDGFSIAYLEINNGEDFPSHVHANRCAWFYIVHGAGSCVLDGETIPISTGDTIFIKPGTDHMFIADPGPLHYLVVVRPDLFTPDPDGSYDVVFPDGTR